MCDLAVRKHKGSIQLRQTSNQPLRRSFCLLKKLFHFNLAVSGNPAITWRLKLQCENWNARNSYYMKG